MPGKGPQSPRNVQRAKPSAPAPHRARAAVAYLRVSSKEQDKEGFSIPAQRKLLQQYAAVHGITTVHEFTDVETAKRTGRVQFSEVVSFLRKNAATCTLVEDHPVLEIPVKAIRLLHQDELNVEIHLVKENEVISEDSRSSEKFMHGIKVLMAKNDIDNLGEESKKGMLEKAEEGIWPSQAPLGYRNVMGASGKRVIEPDPEAAVLVAGIFEKYSTGLHSLAEISRVAQGDGLRSNKHGVVPKSTIHSVLRNRIYMGEVVWHGRVYAGPQ